MKKSAVGYKSVTFLAAGMVMSGIAFGAGAGEFEGSAPGRNGPLKVAVTIQDGVMKNIAVREAKETVGVGDVAMTTLAEEMLRNQTAAVDSISGATLTSEGFKKAVVDALSKGGLGDSVLTKPKQTREKAVLPKELRADAVIIGGGGAGLVAAARAVEAGGSVIVIEKMAMLGGNTARSEGRMSAMDPSPEKLKPMTDALKAIVEKVVAAPTDNPEILALQKTVRKQLDEHYQSGKTYIFDSPEFFALQTLIGGNQKAEPKLVLAMARHATEAMLWLDAQSEMTWDHITRRHVDMGIGGLYPRAQAPVGKEGSIIPISTYKAYIAPLAEKVKKSGSKILLNTKAESLIVENGRVVGVKAVTKDGASVRLTADRGVILASGGYGANLDKVRQYNGINVVATSNAPGTTGEVLDMAVKAGAALTGMEFIQIHPHGNPKNGELMSNVAGRTQDTPYVNKLGRRVADETGRRDVISKAILAQPGAVVYSIMDSRTLESKRVLPEHMAQAVENGYAFKADTLDGLAKAAGIDAKGFAEEMAAYNKAASKQSDAGLSIPKAVVGWTVEKAPFYAVPLTVTIHHTMGGVRIDDSANVLRADGSRIPGLYACGEVTGGIHGANRLGRNALTDILVFGSIAGQSVMKH